MKTSATPTTAPRSRSPKGVDSVLRINIALMPDERTELLRRAAKEERTIAAMARVFLLRGMQADQKPTADQRKAIPRSRKSRLAISITNHGSQSDSKTRLLFCNHLISLIQNYHRRAEFIAAYSTGGTVSARVEEAERLADTYVSLPDLEEFVVRCVEMSKVANNLLDDFGNKPEIV